MRLARRLGRALLLLCLGVWAALLACNLYVILQERITGETRPGPGGFFTAVILSGSMEPALQVNDLIVTRAQADYAVGDVITFRSDASLVTHRIVGETAEGFVTQGDANNAPDAGAVPAAQIMGRVVARIPGLGLLSRWMKTPSGLIAFALTGLGLMALSALRSKRNDSPADDEETQP